jgi:polysaccharide export outer membrane protein
VTGQVGRPTRVNLTRDMRVLEAVTEAGGFGPFADKSNVRVIRRNQDATESEYRFDYDAYIRGRAPGTNIVLQHGDTIIVPD